MKFNSIRFKISVLYVSILGAILIFYSGILYLSLKHTLYAVVDNGLKMKIQDISSAINSYMDILGYDNDSFIFAVKRIIKFEGEHPYKDKIEGIETKWLEKVDKSDLREDYINFLDYQGNTIIDSANMSHELSSLFKKYSKETFIEEMIFRNLKINKDVLRIISTRISFSERGDYILQVGTSLKPTVYILKKRLIFIAVSIPAILFLAAFIGQLFAARILKPVVEITKTAKNITHENLSARVKAEHIDMEMRYLVDAFNDMIGRLEDSFNYIREFSSHIAHELKTPLAIILGESEVALRKEHNAEEYKRVINVSIQETGRMLKTINDILLLTRLDYMTDVFKFKQIDLVEFLYEIFEQAKILAAKKDIMVSIDINHNQLMINADTFHLRRLFLNLIDNAIKSTPQKGHISIKAESHNNTVKISISDTGVGITEEDLPQIFNRFYRGDRLEANNEQGAGLGLSIALSIAKIHKGDIYVKSELGKGSTFTVALPIIDSIDSPTAPQ